MLEELTSTRALLDDPRRTEISDHLGDQDDEDLIPVEDMVVTIAIAAI